jgi:hypothetical protein
VKSTKVTMIANSTAPVNAGRLPPAFLAVSMSLTSYLPVFGYLPCNVGFR